MKPQHRWIGITVAVTGVVTCLVVLAGFFVTVAHNKLPWSPEQSPREYYLAVGKAYGDGFAVGFFMSFFLVTLALALAAWIEHYRNRPRKQVRARSATPYLPSMDRN